MQDSEDRVLGLDLAVAEDRPPDPLVLADVYEVEVEREREVRHVADGRVVVLARIALSG